MEKNFANIYAYADYRKFLDDYQQSRKRVDKRFNRSKICHRLGLPNSRSFFNDVVKGRKNISSSFVERFVDVFELDVDEAQYFRTLVSFNQSGFDKEREILFEQLIALNKTPKKFMNPNEYAFYSSWHHSAVRAMLDILNIKNDYDKLGKSLFTSISAKNAEKSINLLKKLKLIRRNRHGYWKPSDKALTTGPYAQDELIKQYQLISLEKGKKTLLSVKHQPNSMSTMTISVSDYIRKKIETRIQNLKKEIISMVHKDSRPAEHVYQLNMHYFPHSRQINTG